MEIKCFQYFKYWPRFEFKQLLTESDLLIMSACACYAYEKNKKIMVNNYSKIKQAINHFQHQTIKHINTS